MKPLMATGHSRVCDPAEPGRLEAAAAEGRLRETERRLNAVLDNATVAIFLMNEVQHCVYMNAAAERLTGFRLAETLGRPLHDVIHHTRPDGSPFPLRECAIDRAFPEKAGAQGEDVFVHKDGHFYPVAYTASPVHDDEAQVVGTIIEVRDIGAEKRHEEARTLLMREVDHRARNVLAVVQSLTRLTQASDLETYKLVLLGRIRTLARVQTALANRRWEAGNLQDVLREELAALCIEDQVAFCGPDVALSPDQVQPLSMIIHELATNAARYGACSQTGGRLLISWGHEHGRVDLEWRETGGPLTGAPAREGFGSRLVTNLVRQLGGSLARRWEPAGLVVEVSFPAQPAAVFA